MSAATPPAVPPAAPPEPPPANAASPEGERHSPARARHLFRVMTRLGLVHPLQHLLHRYRAGERG